MDNNDIISVSLKRIEWINLINCAKDDDWFHINIGAKSAVKRIEESLKYMIRL